MRVLFLCGFIFAAILSSSWEVRGADQQPEESKTVMHVVKEGDTLAKIAYRYYGTGKKYQLIADANKLSNPHRIIIGSVLVIPPLPVELPKTEELHVSTSVAPALPALSTAPFTWRYETNSAFTSQEKLNFSVAWQFIVVGYATMEIRGTEIIQGREAYHIVTEARSAPFFDTFYKVRNTNESWMDVESLCSLKYASDSHEKNFTGQETMMFDQRNHTYQIVEKNKSGSIPPWTQDVLSALYYIRTLELEVGKEYSVDAHSGDTSWPLTVKVVGTEKVKVPAGKFDCLVLEPQIREGAGLFQAKGKLWVWVTNDQKKTPVLMRSKIVIGSIEARLKSME